MFEALFGKPSGRSAQTKKFGNTSLDNANKQLQRLIATLALAAEEAKMEFALCVRGAKSLGVSRRTLQFEGRIKLAAAHVTTELDRIQSELIEDARGVPLYEPQVRLDEVRDGLPLVRWFAGFAEQDSKLATALIGQLELQLATSDKYCFECWNRTKLLAGESTEHQLTRELEAAHCGVLLLSDAFFATFKLSAAQLATFIDGRGQGAPGKRVVPLALSELDFENTNLRGLEHHEIFHDEDGKAFGDRSGRRRERWVRGLKGHLHQLLARYALPPGSEASVGETARTRSPTIAETKAQAANSHGVEAQTGEYADETCRAAIPHKLEDLDGLSDSNLLQEDAKGISVMLDAKSLSEPARATPEGESVLDVLLGWVAEPAAPPLFALLGEYGMGKTITCQRLVRELEDRRSEQPELPEPLYFDLRNLTGLKSGKVPTLFEILSECIQRGWAAGSALPTAEELIGRAQRETLLFVFDGLDEALVHLQDRDGQAFTAELLRLQPQARSRSRSRPRSPLAASTRILISCRTHFFRTLRDQQSHFIGQDRDGAPADQYRAFQLLPFDEKQIRSYFAAALPALNAEATLELVRSVHNLSDLASRPYTLRLVSEFIPQLERLRAAGERVFGITLYRNLVDQWLHRDDAKHQLKPSHKRRMMPHLAAWMWREGQRTLDVDAIEAWFHHWLAGEPDLQLRYAKFSPDELEEDLRTATFLVREDEPKPGGFRFAHSSIQEFFLAESLFLALCEDRREDWCLPEVSQETWGFLRRAPARRQGSGAARNRPSVACALPRAGERALARLCTERPAFGRHCALA